MYAFLLIVCTQVHGGLACLPPQRYADLATCRAVGDSYRRATVAMNPYAMTESYPMILQARCVRIVK